MHESVWRHVKWFWFCSRLAHVTMWRDCFSKLRVCECANVFFWCVRVGLSVFLCFCSVSVCGQAIHQSVDSTARRITFPLPAHIPPILPFYLTPHSVPPDAPSLSGFIPVTYSECHRSHYHNMFLPLNRDVAHAHRRRVPLQEWHFPLP